MGFNSGFKGLKEITRTTTTTTTPKPTTAKIFIVIVIIFTNFCSIMMYLFQGNYQGYHL